ANAEPTTGWAVLRMAKLPSRMYSTQGRDLHAPDWVVAVAGSVTLSGFFHSVIRDRRVISVAPGCYVKITPRGVHQYQPNTSGDPSTFDLLGGARESASSHLNLD